MEDIDLTGVDPLRRAEVRRRVRVVKDFLAIASPTEADRKKHAADLGLSANQFMALVRAWREHQEAAKVAGSGACRGAPRRPSRLTVPAAAKELAAAVITEFGPDAAFVRINGTVAEKCVREGLAPPSRSTVWNMVMAERQRHQGGDGGIVVGVCRVRLPVACGETLVLPSITLAVRTHDGAVLAAAMPHVAMDWLGLIASIDGTGTQATIDQELLPPHATLSNAIKPIASTAARSALARVLGRGLDDLRLVYIAGKAIAPERLLTTREDQPLSPDEARQVTVEAVARHNSMRRAADAVWITPAMPPGDAKSP